MKNSLFFLFTIILFISSCKKNDDVVIDEETEEVKDVVLGNEANDFTWKAMNSYYLWQDEVIELGDDRFADKNDYHKFLNGFNSPIALFQTLKSPKDRFSAIVDDYDLLFNVLSGVYTTNGIDFVLTRPPEGGNKVVGVVRYVINDSDAATKNVNRGDVFYAVNGVELFAETDIDGNITSSNLDLLDPETFTLNFAEISENNETVPNDVNIELTKAEITEDPILVSKTLEVSGIKIGYIMYNSFPFDSDIALNEAIGVLKSENIDELVLDLRYNGGGSGQTAQRLCSMITGQFTNELLGRDMWNAKWNNILGSQDFFVDTIDETPINHLNLDKVYIIATDDTASASEYVLNNLAPYIDVIHIGDVTVGKNQLSVSLVDNPGQVYKEEGRQDLPLPYIVLGGEYKTVENSNSKHKYALQPIVGQAQNADGFGEFTDGLQPDFLLQESLGNLGQLGEQGEPLLDLAIEKITGVTSKASKSYVPDNMKIKTISSSTRMKPYGGTIHKGFIGIN
ncbi:hypothetical protein JQC67_15580 [Aurantibacter crassamenti]|uniref:S41 family peptidase n=1 Tax=Aurantibacter crassamenti TaxID=1837375 RepID=UPI0019395E9B|nr:S41 family peptidase [Aurantibacter crassamenti]MBM1107576.1 hypothetical protein [Aurantibacter crassamenti]